MLQHLQTASKSLCDELMPLVETPCRQKVVKTLLRQFSTKGPEYSYKSYWAVKPYWTVRRFEMRLMLQEWNSGCDPEIQKEHLIKWLTHEAPRMLFKEIVSSYNDLVAHKGLTKQSIRRAEDADEPLYGSYGTSFCEPGNSEDGQDRRFSIQLTVTEIIDKGTEPTSKEASVDPITP